MPARLLQMMEGLKSLGPRLVRFSLMFFETHFLILQVQFKGTVKFASRAMHRGVESGFKDDLECWIFSLADLMLRSNVPWRYETNVELVAEMKESVFQNTETLFPGQEVFVEMLNNFFCFFAVFGIEANYELFE